MKHFSIFIGVIACAILGPLLAPHIAGYAHPIDPAPCYLQDILSPAGFSVNPGWMVKNDASGAWSGIEIKGGQVEASQLTWLGEHSVYDEMGRKVAVFNYSNPNPVQQPGRDVALDRCTGWMLYVEQIQPTQMPTTTVPTVTPAPTTVVDPNVPVPTTVAQFNTAPPHAEALTVQNGQVWDGTRLLIGQDGWLEGLTVLRVTQLYNGTVGQGQIIEVQNGASNIVYLTWLSWDTHDFALPRFITKNGTNFTLEPFQAGTRPQWLDFDREGQKCRVSWYSENVAMGRPVTCTNP